MKEKFYIEYSRLLRAQS